MPHGVDLRRRGLVAALITAAGVLVVTLAQEVLTALVGLVGGPAFGPGFGSYLGLVAQDVGVRSLSGSLAFSAGVFFCLWQIAPIGGVLRLGHVVTRSLLAAGLGAVAAFIVGAIAMIVLSVIGTSDVAFVTGNGSGPAGELLFQMLQALKGAATTFIAAAPLVVLAGILLWIWSRERKRDDLSGVLDL